jgi:hypothetical protein
VDRRIAVLFHEVDDDRPRSPQPPDRVMTRWYVFPMLLAVLHIHSSCTYHGFRSIGVLFIDSINSIPMLAKHQRSRFLAVLMLSILVPEYIRSPTIIRPSTRAPTLIYHTFMRMYALLPILNPPAPIQVLTMLFNNDVHPTGKSTTPLRKACYVRRRTRRNQERRAERMSIKMRIRVRHSRFS